MTKIERFGIKQNVTGKYAIVTDISEDKKYYHESYSQVYVCPKFAIKKAENFIKLCRQDFTNSQGEKIHFEFVNMGIL